ncbi:MAG: helix-turn-helix domain-containing protein [Dehalococcoidia bacterium]
MQDDAMLAELNTPDQAPTGNSWLDQQRRLKWQIAEELNFAPLTPDIEFVAFLRSLSRFGFFTFGPITIDVRVVEDLLMRTAPRGTGGPGHPPISQSMVRFSYLLYERGNREKTKLNELDYLLALMRCPDGLPARVFGELGVSPEDVERYAAELSAGRPEAPPAERLYSTEEAAAYYGVHVQTVRAWIRSGKLPASRLAGQKSIRIREGDLKAVLERIDPKDMP